MKTYKYPIDTKLCTKKITPKLLEQVRRFVTRLTHEFHFNQYYLQSLSGDAFEQWHEDRAREVIALILMPEDDRAKEVEKLKEGSSNPRRLEALK